MSGEKEVEKEVAETTIEDSMGDLFDEIQGRDAEPERPRGPDGKFLKVEKEEETKVESKETEVKDVKIESEPKTEPEPKTEVKTETEVLRPPSSWSAAAKAKFNSLEPDIQKEVLKREEDFHKGIEQYKNKATFGDTLYREIAPYEAMIRSIGSTPEQMVRNLLNTAYTLSTGTPQQKAQTLKYISQQYGIDLSGLTADVEYTDPETSALQQRLNQLESTIRNQSQQTQQQETQSLTAQIEAFKNDPKNIFFEDVRLEMGALINAGRATGLQDAYDMAIWARPDIRSQLIAKQQQDAEAKRIEEAKKTALEAQKAGSVNVRGKTVTPKGVNSGNSILDTMSEVFDSIQSRNPN